MAVNKVVFGNTTVMDITDSTVTANKLKSGEYAYGANGQKIVGTLVVPEVLNDLSDVVITTPQTAQEIYFDGTNWINYGAKIILTFDDDFKGQIITLTKGQTTITKTAPLDSNTMNLYINETGLWTISSEISGDTYETEVNVTTFGISFDAVLSSVPPIPEGATVLPTDDISIWLVCANITDKSYTTLAEVLADRSTFETLIADSNACDYMARSTSWANDVADDANSMALIGRYDYCSNALLSNATWCEAIAESDYTFANPLIPTMTSDTTPSGTVSYSSRYSGLYGYYAFDNNTSHYWSANGWTTTGEWLQYTFDNEVLIDKISYHIAKQTGSLPITDCEIQAFVNGEWTTLATETSVVDAEKSLDVITIKTSKIRVIATGSNSNIAVYSLQVNGKTTNGATNTNGIIHTAMGNDSVYCVETGDTFTATDGIATVDFSQFDEGVYTFGSTTAKNPNDLSQDYTKQFRITKSPYGGTTELYLMPDAVKTLYWWGYVSDNLQNCTSANGWSVQTYSMVAPTYNTSNISMATSSNQLKGVGTASKVNLSSVKAIATGVTISSSVYAVEAIATAKDINNLINYNYLNSNSIALVTLDASTSGEYNVTFYVTAGRNSTLHALWYE